MAAGACSRCPSSPLAGVALYLANPGVAGLVGIALAGAAVISTFGITIVVSQSTCRGGFPPPQACPSASRSASAAWPRSRSVAWPTRSGSSMRSGRSHRRCCSEPVCAPCSRPPIRLRRPRDGSTGARRRAHRARQGPFDLLVVGGGIVGCAVAWLGARAGLRVALVERGDLAGATSSASSKLIHGGLRYLAYGRHPPSSREAHPGGCAHAGRSPRTSCGRARSSSPSTAAALSGPRSCERASCCTGDSVASRTAGGACCVRRPRARSCRACG